MKFRNAWLLGVASTVVAAYATKKKMKSMGVIEDGDFTPDNYKTFKAWALTFMFWPVILPLMFAMYYATATGRITREMCLSNKGRPTFTVEIVRK